MKRHQLYDYVYTNDDNTPSFLQINDAAGFDPDPEEQRRTGEYGICVVLKIRTPSGQHLHSANLS